MKTPMANDRDLFDCLIRHEALRRLRTSFDSMLGNPVWWVTFKFGDSPAALGRSIEASHEIWNDPRVRKYRFPSQLFNALKRKVRETKPFVLTAQGDTLHYCMPLVFGDRVIGHIGLSGIQRDASADMLALLAVNTELIVEACAKTEELKRLSATIRPRAIALSTVHTVHRIINSTLNLNELISRLAHLTAQVLRANRCAIFLVGGKPTAVSLGRSGMSERGQYIECKALVGYPKRHDKNFRIPHGKGLEGGVAKTARIILRKNFICIPLIDEDVMGVMTVSFKKDNKPFTYFDQEIITTLAEEAVIAIKNAQLYEEQRRVTLGTIQSLAVILGSRVDNVISPEVFLRIALRMAEKINLSEEDTQALHYATLLKDTAKIGIPDEILKKPSKLSGEEYRLLREHPIKGAQIVQSFESLKPVVPIILYSREKYDGTGYPKGLKGDKIPIGARILAIINAFEAIIIGRPYRDRSTLDEALEEIVKNRGTQFDPKLVDVFIQVIHREDFHKLLKKSGIAHHAT
jgi:hypothetical protein